MITLIIVSKKLYRYYESCYIPEKVALSNNLIGYITKKAFNRLCAEYEASNEYANNELDEINKTSGLLLEKPKRDGRTKSMQEKFTELILLVDSRISVIELFHKLGIQPMTKNTYLRFLLNYENGKKWTNKNKQEIRKNDITNEITK